MSDEYPEGLQRRVCVNLHSFEIKKKNKKNEGDLEEVDRMTQHQVVQSLRQLGLPDVGFAKS